MHSFIYTTNVCVVIINYNSSINMIKYVNIRFIIPCFFYINFFYINKPLKNQMQIVQELIIQNKTGKEKNVEEELFSQFNVFFLFR